MKRKSTRGRPKKQQDVPQAEAEADTTLESNTDVQVRRLLLITSRSYY